MQHVAIMEKKWGLIEKILSGRKKIESRWYISRRAPWDKIREEEKVYFKNSGGPVSAKAEVMKVMQFSDLTRKKIKKILTDNAYELGIENKDIEEFYGSFKDKRYCILIFLRNPKRIRPFEINKKGFGIMSAWVCVDDINEVKK